MTITAQSFPLRIPSVNLVTFTQEIVNGKLHSYFGKA